jgi:hypothetical protein
MSSFDLSVVMDETVGDPLLSRSFLCQVWRMASDCFSRESRLVLRKRIVDSQWNVLLFCTEDIDVAYRIYSRCYATLRDRVELFCRNEVLFQPAECMGVALVFHREDALDGSSWEEFFLGDVWRGLLLPEEVLAATLEKNQAADVRQVALLDSTWILSDRASVSDETEEVLS